MNLKKEILEKVLCQLPKGWVWATLEEITLPIKRTNRHYENPNETFNYIDIEAIDNNLNKIKKSKNLTWGKAPSRAQLRLKTNDILFSTVRPNLKNIAIVNEQYDNSVASSGFCVIRTSFVNAKYVFFYIINQEFVNTVSKQAKGTSYPAVTNDIVLNQRIPLPPISDQINIIQRIEELFSELTEAQESLLKTKRMLKISRYISLLEGFTGKLTAAWRKQNSDQLKELSTNHLSKRNIKKLTLIPKEWKWTTIGNCSEMIGSGSTPKGGRNVYLKAGVPFIRSQNIHFGQLKNEDQVFISSTMNREMQRSIVKAKDVLLNITGASIGRSSFVPEDFKQGNVNQHVCIIRPIETISYKYLSYYLNSSPAQIHINKINSGATREALTLEQIRNFPLPYCSLEEQNLVVENIEYKLAIIENLEETIDQNLLKIDIFRQSVLKKAFIGKLSDVKYQNESADALLQNIKNYKKEFIIQLKNESTLLPKKRKVMQEKLSILEVLKKAGKALPTDEIWLQSSYSSNIDEFYSALKEHVEKNEIKEISRKGKLSYLTINKQK